MKSLLAIIKQKWGIFFTLAVILVFFGLSSPYYFTTYNLMNILNHMTITLILALGMVFVLSSGGIDLSIGSTLGFIGIVVALLFQANVPVVFAVGLGLLIAAGIGVINATFITKFRIQPFIMTLAMLSIIRGLALVLSKGQPIYGFPTSFTNFFAGQVGLPTNVYLVIALVAAASILAHKTKFGLFARSLGGNEEAAFFCGINVYLMKVGIYALQGMMAAMASFVYMSFMDTAEPLAGLQTEWLEAIAAPIIGGNSLTGGTLSISGTVMGALILACVRNGLNIIGVQTFFQQLFIGLIIIVSVIIDSLRARRKIRRR